MICFVALQNFSPALLGQLTLFGREVMDLLKSQTYCLVQFNKFIPTYHHHFGRQCRVADYGFTKLIDLLEAIPHIVQVIIFANVYVCATDMILEN